LTLCVIGQFGAVGGKVVLDETISPSLPGFDLNA